MRCHPLMSGFKVPRVAVLGPYRLTTLCPQSVEEDYAAVMESKDRLSGLMGGDWPNGLTLEKNRIDLSWHLKEFEMNRSFAWIIRDVVGTYLGCAYVFPDFTGHGAFVPVWMRTSAGAEAHERAFSALLMGWLIGPDWPAFEYRLKLPGS